VNDVGPTPFHSNRSVPHRKVLHEQPSPAPSGGPSAGFLSLSRSRRSPPSDPLEPPRHEFHRQAADDREDGLACRQTLTLTSAPQTLSPRNLNQLACGAAYRNVSFKLRAGEVLGITGVIGSGREELTRTLAGFAPHTAGNLKVAGREVRLETPADAVDLGIGYIPRERRVEGLVLFLSVSANITLADLASLTRFGLIDARKERGVAADWTSRLKIRTPNIHTLCLGLSGGNQQKGRPRKVAERQGENSCPRSPDPRPGRGRQEGGLRAHSRLDR
jgi:ABC-type glutathione transport system ATPase component